MRTMTFATGAALWVVLPLAFAGAARADESVTGRIEVVRMKGTPIQGATKDVVANILVGGMSLHLTKDTVLVFADARRATLADLKVGRRVSARLHGDIGCTLPPQCVTDVVVIHAMAEGGGRR